MRTMALLVLAFVLGTSQVEAQKRYLVLGADPQASNRQPIPGVEEIVIIDHDICDSGWGSGSGRKSSGCYPAHSAVIRNIATGIVTAMYVCGNEPSDEHRVTGKVVPASEVVYVPGPQGPQGPMGPAGPRGPQGLDGQDFVPLEIGSGGHSKWWLWTGLGIAGAILGKVAWDHFHKDGQAPGVTSDDSSVTCTGIPCPSAPTVGARRMGGFSISFP